MQIGRNEACPCGSGRKYKQCCLNKSSAMSLQYKLLLAAGGVILIVCIILLIGSIRNFEPGTANRVWSEEHQHWHYQ
jgi:hypothetical protein